MLSPTSTYVLAHIGKIPVEEWLPFVVPIVALYIYFRRKERRRRKAVAVLPATSDSLDEATVNRILDEWRAASYGDVSPEHLPLLYPPGPDGMSVTELADRTHSSPETVELLLQQLEEREYLDLEGGTEPNGPRALLTLKGYGLVDATESALLTALAEGSAPRREAD